MAIDVLLGLQWGDEGKGKIVDVLAPDYDIIARFQGGPNAGHTLFFNGEKHVLHTIPSGIFHLNTLNIIGNGVVIDPVTLAGELERLNQFGIDPCARLLVSRKAHLILPTHRLLDAASEASKGKANIGSTLKGIGPAYMDKTGRNGLRAGDLELPGWEEKYRSLVKKHQGMIQHYKTDIPYNLPELETAFFQAIEKLKSLSFIDSEHYLQQALRSGKRILAEGAQGALLDIDFGTYPYVTSSNTTSAGACTGLGIPPASIGEVIGIFKAYTTRVGSGPFPTELTDETGETMGRIGKEFGATTGRKRRCGWLDLVALKYTVQLNGVTRLAMMKADVLSGFETLKIATSYTLRGEKTTHFPYSIDPEYTSPVYTEMKGWQQEIQELANPHALPQELREYITFIERELSVPINIISLGPDRKQTLYR